MSFLPERRTARIGKLDIVPFRSHRGFETGTISKKRENYRIKRKKEELLGWRIPELKQVEIVMVERGKER